MKSDEIKRMIAAAVMCMIIMFGWQYYMVKKYPNQAKPNDPVKQAPADAAATDSSAPVTETPSGTTSAEPSMSAVNSSPKGWHVLPADDIAISPVVFGSRQKVEDGYKAEIAFDPVSASVSTVLLSEHKFKVTDEETGYPLLAPAVQGRSTLRNSLMLGKLKLKGRSEVFDLSGHCWKQTKLKDTIDSDVQELSFTATIASENGEPVIDVIKSYTYQKNDYNLYMTIRLENKTTLPIEVEDLELYGPIGVLREDPRSDMRCAIATYVGPEGQVESIHELASAIESNPEKGVFERPEEMSLRWIASANKFFAATLCPMKNDSMGTWDYFGDSELVAQIATITDMPGDVKHAADTPMIKTHLKSIKPIEMMDTGAFDFNVFMGPIDHEIFENDQKFAGLHYEKLMSNRGCNMCAFDWLTTLLLKMMTWTYNVFGNYGIAIIVLVLLVRLILHPISKKSQVSMMKMQKMAPKIEEIKRKYAGNDEEIQKRTVAIYKEQGAAPLLGCLPMMLQMPIWIALFTAVGYNVALRHQGLLPASWHWLNDLAAPDRLIPLSVFGITKPLEIPLIGALVGSIDAINLLPILLAVAMFLQQKYSPQTKMAPATEQAAQQQKMMLYLMPGMMVLFFYGMPSGLNLYIMASTFGGLIEQHFIRKHLKEDEAAAEVNTTTVTSKISNRLAPKKKKPKPPFKQM